LGYQRTVTSYRGEQKGGFCQKKSKLGKKGGRGRFSGRGQQSTAVRKKCELGGIIRNEGKRYLLRQKNAFKQEKSS